MYNLSLCYKGYSRSNWAKQRFERFKTGPAGQDDHNWDQPEWMKAAANTRYLGDCIEMGRKKGGSCNPLNAQRRTRLKGNRAGSTSDISESKLSRKP